MGREATIRTIGMKKSSMRNQPFWLILLLGDVAAGSFAVFLTLKLSPSTVGILQNGSSNIVLFILCLVIIFSIFGLYDFIGLSSGDNEYSRLFGATNFLFIVIIGLQSFLYRDIIPADQVSLADSFDFWLILIASMSIMRFVMRRFAYLLKSSSSWKERAIILGANREGFEMARQWSSLKSSGLEVVGFLDDTSEIGSTVANEFKVIGRSKDLEAIIQEKNIDCLLVADPDQLRKRLDEDYGVVGILEKVELQISTGVSEFINTGLRARECGFVPVMVLQKRRVTGLHSVIKAVLDYIGALVLLLLLLPLFIVLAILIKIESPGPVLHRRRCIGAGHQQFDMLKFRSMFMDGDSRLSDEQKAELAETLKLNDDPRITKIGKFIRKLSIDELPQLINVLIGEMSLVGPRPITEPEMEKFGKVRHIRVQVKPGLTGLWQVSGRSDLTVDERVLLDAYYVRNYTIWMDVKILLQTIPAVLLRKGAY